jgi:hypothetical protein
MCSDVRRGVRGHELKYEEQLGAVEEIVRLVEFGIFVIVTFLLHVVVRRSGKGFFCVLLQPVPSCTLGLGVPG